MPNTKKGMPPLIKITCVENVMSLPPKQVVIQITLAKGTAKKVPACPLKCPVHFWFRLHNFFTSFDMSDLPTCLKNV